MSRAGNETRLDDLLQLLSDQRLEEKEAVELAQLLSTSESARRRYVETVQLCLALGDSSQSIDAVAQACKSPEADAFGLDGNSATAIDSLHAGHGRSNGARRRSKLNWLRPL